MTSTSINAEHTILDINVLVIWLLFWLWSDDEENELHEGTLRAENKGKGEE